MSFDVNEVRAAAEGRWLEICGILAPQLAPAMEKIGTHVPCPVHGGDDGFRLFKDFSKSGGGICNTCGAIVFMLHYIVHTLTKKPLFMDALKNDFSSGKKDLPAQSDSAQPEE